MSTTAEKELSPDVDVDVGFGSVDRAVVSSSTTNVVEKEDNIDADVGVGFGDVDKAGDDAAEVEDSAFGGETKSEMANIGTYPADCYSFMSIHGPFDKTPFFYFGFLVWAFQVSFLILLVLRVAHPTLSTNENDDNPDQGQGESFAFANFVPSNNNILSKATQYMALASYCFFADASVRDIVTAVETFPNFSRVKPGDRVDLIIFSCVLRLTQGFLATVVVFLLVINTSDVIDIILNFTAVNFISDFDDVAFGLCQWGKYGPKLKAEADRIETMPAPACIYRKYQYIRYRFTIIPLAIFLLSGLLVVSVTQNSLEEWLTTELRIQFKDDPLREGYNGCYKYVTRQNRRVLFESYPNNAEQAKIGYCQDTKKWILFTGNKTLACDVSEKEMMAFSSKTYTFDISTVFEDTWYSPTGTPLELYFFDDQKNEFTEEQCGSFVGDGICDEAFNRIDHNYDNGDCCGTTCDSLNCGMGNTMSDAFNTKNFSGNGYRNCEDPQMKPITIKLDSFYFSTETTNNFNVSIATQDPFADFPPIDPPLALDCNGKNLLMVNINEAMTLQTETIWIPDGANCVVYVKNTTAGVRRLPFVNYTIYHGDENSIDNDPIVIVQADSFEEGMYSFQRIPECFFKKLKSHVDISTIYTGNGPSNKAIRWLLEDSLGFSNCEYDTFLERYALATINYAAPIVNQKQNSEGSSTGLWISSGRQCEWLHVACIDGRVIELDLGDMSLSGTIATELGLMKTLTWLNLGDNKLYGSIPSQIAEWKRLVFFSAENNYLSGHLPTEIGNMKHLGFLGLMNNRIDGTIPSEIGKMTSLVAIGLNANNFVGTIPNEISEISNLEVLFLDDNSITGTIPTVLGTLSNLMVLVVGENLLRGTIPTELSGLTNLNYLYVNSNALTGSIPASILEMDVEELEYFGNNLSGLIPLDGEVICSTDGSEVYCNCESDCTFASPRCACEEGQSCCSAYLEPYTYCTVCPSGVENPRFVLPDYLLICAQMHQYIENDVTQFGNEEKCDTVGKPFFHDVGCRCISDSGEDNGGGDGNLEQDDSEQLSSVTVEPMTEDQATRAPVITESPVLVSF